MSKCLVQSATKLGWENPAGNNDDYVTEYKDDKDKLEQLKYFFPTMTTTKLLNCVYTSEDEDLTYITGLQLFLDANSYEEISGIDNQTPLNWHGFLTSNRNINNDRQN